MDRDNLRAKGLVLLIFVAAVAISFIVSNRRDSAIRDAVDEALEDRNYTDEEYHELSERNEEYEAALFSIDGYYYTAYCYYTEDPDTHDITESEAIEALESIGKILHDLGY